GDLEASVGMLLEKAKKIFALHEIHLAGVNGFGSQLVGLARNRRAQAENLARLGDFQYESFSIRRADGEFDPSFAKDKNAAWSLALNEQNSPLRIGGGVFDGFEGLQRRGRQVTEDSLCPHFAGQAAFDDVQSVWREHKFPPVTMRSTGLVGSIQAAC